MKSRKKLFALLAISLIFLMLFIFIAGKKGEEKPAEKAVLNVSFSLGESEWDVMRTKVFPAFEEK